jgi:hypothetical protein
MASLRNVEDDALGPQYDNEQLADFSVDKPIADAPQDEDEEHRRIRLVKNGKRTQHRRNTWNCAREPRDLNNAFAEAAILAQQFPPNPQIQRLQYLTQRALVQLNGQLPVSSTQN